MDGPVFPGEIKKQITRVLKQSSPWSIAKTVGKSYIPSGEPTQAYNKIYSCFKDKGLFVVEVGELEGFVRSIGKHGPKWVNNVLKKDLYNDQELSEARDFLAEITKG